MEEREVMEQYQRKTLAQKDVVAYMLLTDNKDIIKNVVEQWIQKVENNHKDSPYVKNLFPKFREQIKKDQVIVNFLFFMLLAVDPKLEETFFEENKSFVHPQRWADFMIDLINETDRLFKGDNGHFNQYTNIENFVNHIITMYIEFINI